MDYKGKKIVFRGFTVDEVGQTAVEAVRLDRQYKDDPIKLLEEKNKMSLSFLQKCIIEPKDLSLSGISYKVFKQIDDGVRELSGLEPEEVEN